jgi:hypothetical protein
MRSLSAFCYEKCSEDIVRAGQNRKLEEQIRPIMYCISRTTSLGKRFILILLRYNLLDFFQHIERLKITPDALYDNSIILKRYFASIKFLRVWYAHGPNIYKDTKP